MEPFALYFGCFKNKVLKKRNEKQMMFLSFLQKFDFILNLKYKTTKSKERQYYYYYYYYYYNYYCYYYYYSYYYYFYYYYCYDH